MFQGARPRPEVYSVLLSVCTILVGALEIQAQTIRGQVFDQATSSGIAQATVEAVFDGEVIGRAVSDSTGSFVLYLRHSGTYRVRASRFGYGGTESELVGIGLRELVELRLPMSSSPIPLEGIEVEARRRDPRFEATYEGLYARRARANDAGTVRVVVRGDPEMTSSSTVRDVLRWFVPPRGCVDYYIDGQPVDPRFWAEVVATFSPDLLEGIEYYRRDWERPVGFAPPPRTFEQTTAICTVLALWRRRPGM